MQYYTLTKMETITKLDDERLEFVTTIERKRIETKTELTNEREALVKRIADIDLLLDRFK